MTTPGRVLRERPGGSTSSGDRGRATRVVVTGRRVAVRVGRHPRSVPFPGSAVSSGPVGCHDQVAGRRVPVRDDG